MSLFAQLHDYSDGGLIDSSDWNDELNQLINTLNGQVVTKRIIISGQTDGINDAILLCKNNSTGDLLSVGVSDFRVLNSGVLRNMFDGSVVELVVSSSIKCPNLNADLLDGVSSAGIQQAKFVYETYSAFYVAGTAATNPDNANFFTSNTECIVTKLKAQQRGVASADASTIITFLRNGVSIGTVTISGNSTAVVTNDIADLPLSLNDVLSISVTTYSGTTKHTDITASVHFKRKFQ